MRTTNLSHANQQIAVDCMSALWLVLIVAAIFALLVIYGPRGTNYAAIDQTADPFAFEQVHHRR
jgi:hypothetical protein